MNLLKYKQYEPIYVIGHSSPDIDAIVSSKILSNILNKLGIKAYQCILDENYEIDEYNMNMIKDCMDDFNPTIIKKSDIYNHNFFLIDHNDRMQSVGKIANVIASIDHHPNAYNVDDVTLSDICSISLYLYSEFKNIYEFSKEEKKQIYYAFLNDSMYGKASRYKESDGLLADELGFGHDYDKYFKKYFIPTNLSNGIESMLYNGLKKYQFDDVHFEGGYIETYGTDGLEEYRKIISNTTNFFGRWVDVKNEKTYVIFNFENKIKEFNYNFIASRSTTILNDVIQYLKEEGYLK